MKKILIAIFIIVILSSCKNHNIKGKENECWAQNYVVMEQSSRKIIEQKNANYCQSVASISKIMTAIIAIESNKLNQLVKIGEEVKTIYGSQVYLKLHDELLLKELVYGLLLRSGNDCAIVIATFIAGSVDEFAKIMNKKAAELGMISTVFRNPHGLDEEDGGNISNCRDMAILQAYCLDNEVYRIISSTKSYKSSKYGVWNNKNRLIKEYEFTTSGKTGYTVKAKRTLITSAKKEQTEFIIVTLNCLEDFKFHKEKYEVMFDKYENRLLLRKGTNTIEGFLFEVEKDLYCFKSKEQWEKSKILYHISFDNTYLEIYLLIENEDKYFLEEYEIIEKVENKTLIEKIRDVVNNFFNTRKSEMYE